MGLFWKKANNKRAFGGAFISNPIAMYFKVAPKGWRDHVLFIDLPWMHQMGLTLLITLVISMIISIYSGKNQNDEMLIIISNKTFATD